jgi:ADP-ribose pyrophosphatase YjhB (NUDIX family)
MTDAFPPLPECPDHAACAGPSVRTIPEGDDRPRLTCPDCGFVVYENPKIVVGAVCSWEGRLLLCRRAIEPSKGLWTLPAGYLELNESTEQGILREAWEEARARIALDGLLAVYNIPRISQVQLIYRARLLSPDVAAGPESTEVMLARWDEVPWDDIAFPTVHWSLLTWKETADRPLGQPGGNPPGKEEGDVR